MFPELGEFLRRAALGLLALLFVTRAYYPSEDADSGSGLVWVLCLIGVAGLGIVANLLSGVTRFRWTWTDGLVITLIVLVGLTAGHAADRRVAITMAWEWGGLGLLYLLARNLPRTRAESTTLAGIMVATGVAVAAYGLYQVSVELVQLRLMFARNPDAMLTQLNFMPGSPGAVAFQNRLMNSSEPFATFALANSLAGFLVGPLVLLLAVGLENLKRDGKGSRFASLGMAASAVLTLLICFILTKSRSAYIGLAVAAAVVVWNYRSVVPRRWLLAVGVGTAVMILALIAAGVASRQLDIQILTEARKSLGYRWEYWVGSWGVITDAPAPFAPTSGSHDLLNLGGSEPDAPTHRAFWWGVGPANFAGPYLRHKLPEASEEIQDPHNMVLEVWAESGLFAMLALVASLVVGVAQILAPARAEEPDAEPTESKARSPRSRSTAWLAVMGGLGWFGVWGLGKLNPVTQDDMLMRWLVLGAAWGLAVILIGPVWLRRPIPAVGLGAAVVAMAVHLLAAGGIGIPSMAMALWLSLALGLNLREDRPAGRLRSRSGLTLGVLLACGWSVIAGTYYGAVVPGWRSDLALSEAQVALAAKPPRYEVARQALTAAIDADRYSIRPWLALADLEYRFWQSPESGTKHKTSWTKVLLTLDKAVEGTYRDPDNLALRRNQASYARKILNELPDAKPFEVLELQGTIAKANRHSVRLYPTSALFRGELASANAELGLFQDAITEARTALQLDAITPHQDKKLPPQIRSYLTNKIPEWEERAKAPIPAVIPK